MYHDAPWLSTLQCCVGIASERSAPWVLCPSSLSSPFCASSPQQPGAHGQCHSVCQAPSVWRTQNQQLPMVHLLLLLPVLLLHSTNIFYQCAMSSATQLPHPEEICTQAACMSIFYGRFKSQAIRQAIGHLHVASWHTATEAFTLSTPQRNCLNEI